MRVGAWLISCCLVQLALAAAGPARADCAEVRWAVVGLSAEERQPMGERVALLREALAAELKRVGSDDLLPEEEVGRRLGLQLHDASYAEAQLEAAELFYFQYQFPSAEESLHKAIETLATRVDARAATRSRAARFLLGAVHLGVGGPEALERARAAIEPLVRIAPEHRPDPRAYPAELIQLFDDLRDELASQPKGRLRVRREDGGAGHVWVDAQPLGAVGSEILLPPGRYRVLVADAAVNPSRLSFLHEVEVRPGEESSLWLDLRWESSADPRDGPSFAWVNERTRVVAASRLSAQLAPSPLVLLWEDAASLHAALYDREQGELIHATSAQKGGEVPAIFATLARGLIGGVAAAAAGEGEAASAPMAAQEERRPPPPDAEAPAAPEDPGDRFAEAPRPRAEEVRELELRLDERLREEPQAQELRWIEPTKWATAGAAVIAAAVGIWVHADAAAQQRELNAWAREQGGVATSVEEGRAAARRSSSIRSQSQLGNGFLVGAGVAGVTSLVLFYLDD